MRAEKEKSKIRRETLFAYSNETGLCGCCGKDAKMHGIWIMRMIRVQQYASQPKGTPYYNRLRKNGFPDKKNIIANSVTVIMCTANMVAINSQITKLNQY